MGELSKFNWTFVKEIKSSKVNNAIKDMLIENEVIMGSYKTVRDAAVITNKRLLIADKQGLTGNKMEIYTIPFKSINMYSSENAGGLFDVNSELEFWTKAGHFKLNLKKGINVRKLDQIIAEGIL